MFKIPQTTYPFIQSALTSGMVRRPVFSMAVGFVLAQAAEMSTVIVKDTNLLAQAAVASLQTDFVGALSDIAPVNSKEILRSAMAWYQYRYSQLHLGEQAAFTTGPSTGLIQLLGLDNWFSPEDLRILQEQTEEFKSVVVGLRDAMTKCIAYQQQQTALL